MVVALMTRMLLNCAYAGEFTLRERETGTPSTSSQKDICDIYLANLNALNAELRSMECYRPVHPRFASVLSKPKWTKLNPLEHAALVRKMDEAYFYKPLPGEDGNKWSERFKDRVERDEVLLFVARVDLDGDGVDERLVKYERGGPCTKNAPRWVKESGAEIFLVNQTLTELTGPFQAGTFLIPGVRHDVLLFRGKPYFDFISKSEGPDKPKLVVQQLYRGSPVPACTFTYKRKAGK